MLFVLLVFPSPTKDIHIWFITYPANTNALVALVSFGVSGIYLSFLLTVIARDRRAARGWVPEGSFRLGSWGWPVYDHRGRLPGADVHQHRRADGADSPRAYFNLDWITLT